MTLDIAKKTSLNNKTPGEKYMTPEFTSWVQSEHANKNVFLVKCLYVDMAGDLIAGLLLSQILYWFTPSSKSDEKGKLFLVKKLQCVKEFNKSTGKEYCLAKNRESWWDECRIKARQYDRAIKILVGKKIVRVKNFKFNNQSTPHIFLNQKTFIKLYNEKVAELKIREDNDDF